MKKALYTVALFYLAAQFATAQVSRDVTPAEAEFMDKVSTALLNSLPKDFKGWDVNFPEYTPAVIGQTRTSSCAHGRDCFWNFAFHVVYDGTRISGPDADSFKDSLKNTAYDWHFPALMSRYINSHQITVDINVNDSHMIGEFQYCPNGFKTLPAPPGFDHYIFASVSSCFPKDAQRNFLDVNIFTMKMAPVVTNHPEKGFSQGDISFPLNTKLASPLKVQTVVVRIYGSKQIAKEFVSKMDLSALKKLVE